MMKLLKKRIRYIYMLTRITPCSFIGDEKAKKAF